MNDAEQQSAGALSDVAELLVVFREYVALGSAGLVFLVMRGVVRFFDIDDLILVGGITIVTLVLMGVAAVKTDQFLASFDDSEE